MTESSPSNSPAGNARATLLIVDDDAQLRGSLVALFRRFGLTVTAAPDGKAALDHLSNHAVGIVVTDIFMAECDGLEFLRMLRQINPRPKVVAMTGAEHAAMPDLLRIATQLGADRTIRKPFQPEALLRLVEDLLGVPELIGDRPLAAPMAS